MVYIQSHNKEPGCVFCNELSRGNDLESLIVYRGKTTFVILNRYPYTSGHLMIVPYVHAATLEELDAETRLEIMDLLTQSIEVLEEVYHPQGYNAGLNLAEPAGAGITGHIHLHVVPRWVGDTNFMSYWARRAWGMRIDLGGFAKGHAVDNAVAILARLGIAHAFVSAGGDSRVIGDRRGRPWTLGVRHPRQADGVVALLPLIDTAVSTSGDYERFFEVDGVRHHHIIDPATGRSPHALHSVTILAADGLTAEAMSKTLFVLGLERGMALIESQAGVDAIVVDAQGRLHYSTGLQDHGPAENNRR